VANEARDKYLVLFVERGQWLTRPGMNIRPYLILVVQHEKRAQ
jgi:hypothetical protein